MVDNVTLWPVHTIGDDWWVVQLVSKFLNPMSTTLLLICLFKIPVDWHACWSALHCVDRPLE